jgi:hypothetical protein
MRDMYESKATDWVKWGSVAAIAAALIALLGIYIVHRDQREKVYITVTPVGWKIDPGGIRRDQRIATAIYDLTVSGKVPAKNVYLRERCVSPVPVGEAIQPQTGREFLGWIVSERAITK